MIKRHLLLLLALLVSAQSVMSEPIQVRAGEHENFTRLVMQLPESVKWQISGSLGERTLSLSGHQEGFDISNAFDVIPRTRLTDLRQTQTGLTLKMTCDCEVNAFVEQGNFLVMDILDGAPLSVTSSQPAISFKRPETPQSDFQYGDLLWKQFERPDAIRKAEETEVSGSVIESENDQTEPHSLIISETRERLLLGLAEAASRGILSPATPQIDEIRTHDSQDTEIFDSSEIVPSISIVPPGNIRISNSRDIPLQTDSLDLMNSGVVCPSPDSVDIANWGSEEPYHAQIGPAREALYGELDRLDLDNALILARLYIFFGFGAEAKQVLNLTPDLKGKNPELMDLAAILELGYARNPRSVHRFSDCNSDLALWSVLAAKQLTKGQVVNSQATLRALAKLPRHLLQIAAPALSQRLLQIEDVDGASNALRMLERDNDFDPTSAIFARAQIKESQGNSQDASELLSKVVTENAPESPEAAIALVENKLKEKDAVPADLALLIEAYAFELRDSLLGSELQRAHVLASAKSGQFAKAFDAMNVPRVLENIELWRELQSHVFEELTREAEDITFLDHFFDNFPESSSGLAPTVLSRIAERLIDLGFFTTAENLLNEMPPHQESTSNRIISARVSLELEEPKNALSELAGLIDAEANELRARALSMVGNNEEARAMYLDASDAPAALTQSWLADDWVNFIPQAEPLFGETQRIAQESIAPIPMGDNMLAQSEQAIANSAAARETIMNLLNGTTIK